MATYQHVGGTVPQVTAVTPPQGISNDVRASPERRPSGDASVVRHFPRIYDGSSVISFPRRLARNRPT